MINQNDIFIKLKIKLKKRFQEQYQFTKNEIADINVIIITMIYEFFDRYINEVRGKKGKKIEGLYS